MVRKSTKACLGPAFARTDGFVGPFTGTYEGMLQKVVAHVLKGFNFVVKSGERGIEITLLGPGNAIAVGGASSAPRLRCGQRRLLRSRHLQPRPPINPCRSPLRPGPYL
jgi:hypothetical protein